ncbi:hypothetical protein [Adonisia turfae]|nr:hypothetical protein [Adonisia turfae]
MTHGSSDSDSGGGDGAIASEIPATLVNFLLVAEPPPTLQAEPGSKLHEKHIMQGEIDQYGFERIQLTSLIALNQLIAERFDLPPRPYTTDLRAALELVIWALDHDDFPYFAIFKSADEAFPSKPFGVGFARKMWRYAETGALAICLDALYQLKQIEVDLKLDEAE